MASSLLIYDEMFCVLMSLSLLVPSFIVKIQGVDISENGNIFMTTQFQIFYGSSLSYLSDKDAHISLFNLFSCLANSFVCLLIFYIILYHC